MIVRIVTPGRLTYKQGLELQEATVAAVQSGISQETLILLEHEPVYTMGRHPNRRSLSLTEELPYPLFETNRGGQATWHGPGQLVGYPILDLAKRGRDLHRYLRVIEDFLIAILTEFGISASRREGQTGVWVEERKIASIGVGVRRWVTMHGFALNVANELEAFARIIPCGIMGVRMTTLAIEREAKGAPGVTLGQVSELVARAFPHYLDQRLPREDAPTTETPTLI